MPTTRHNSSSSHPHPSFTPSPDECPPPVIRRISTTHHGRALRLLGDASERLQLNPAADPSDREAIHLLSRLGREVFDEYAILTHKSRPLTDWIMRQAVRIYEAA